MKLTLILWLAAASFAFSGFVAAQNSMVPPTCANKAGEALRDCVRDITPLEKIEQMTPVRSAADPAQPINCLQLLPADQAFCVSRNEIIIECRNKTKYPNFDKCFSKYAVNVPIPSVADCTRVSQKLRSQCSHRNLTYTKCASDPLRYFMCLEDPGVKK
jgi:hypothetical protein